MGKRDLPFIVKKRAKGLLPLLQTVTDQQRIDDVFISLKDTMDGCKDIIVCANGTCSVIARICPNNDRSTNNGD